jgi:thiamine kinase-like enzyme
LTEESQKFHSSLIPRDTESVLAHNDAQENNILASLYDLTQIIFIDFEYTAWNPRAMDLANYFNETMLDNAHPVGNGIKHYLENTMNEREVRMLLEEYLGRYYDKYYDEGKK